MSARQAVRLMGQRRFLPLFALLQTGTFNDNSLKNALIGLITFGGVAFLSNLPSQIRVPVAAFIFTGPFLLVCAIAGQIADKYDRAKILKKVKRAEVLIMVLAGIGFLTMNAWVLSVALFFMGAQSAFFSPTRNAVMPQWLADDELITGNALISGFVFVFVLVGMVIGLAMVGNAGSARILAGLLFVMALLGWFAAERLPEAPPPNPELNLNRDAVGGILDFVSRFAPSALGAKSGLEKPLVHYLTLPLLPLTATISCLVRAFDFPEVLRPMLGIAWFYGLSAVMVTTLPDLVSSVMGYDRSVLIIILVISTLGILVGSLLCTLLAKGGHWGKESIGLSALGIIGVIIFTADIYLNAPRTSAAADGVLQGFDVFWADGKSRRFLFDLLMASLFSGLFVVPVQAMAQRRARPDIRARLMSAGAVLLNLFVNIVTIMLILLAARNAPSMSPFLMVAVLSLFVAAYTLWRTFNPKTRTSYAR
ncbi:MAG: MFS transporter [Hyphomonadaceae bacterium]|nr:MFS transporter [Hyphomonadaceae bacterium]MBC6411424.1 MFS transporter [Hyphomonadaceae bacterium]